MVDYGKAHADMGHLPPDESIRFQLATAAPIIEHYGRDLTVRAHAGATIGQLQQRLMATGQFLPIDADDDLSLGEVIAHHVYGPMRIAYGSVRDLLLGMSFFDGNGKMVRVGGRTVKNVAGYDLTRFMVGSMGEMGIIHEATIRTYAVPEAVMSVRAELDGPTFFDEHLTALLLSSAEPAALAVTRDKHRWLAQLDYMGTHKACAAQFEGLQAFVHEHSAARVVDMHPRTMAEVLQHGVAQRSWRRTAAVVVKVVVPPASSGAVAEHIAAIFGDSTSCELHLLPAHGCLFVGGNLSSDEVRRLSEMIDGLIESVGGMRTWMRMPNDAHDIAPFAPMRTEHKLLVRLKDTLDPAWRLNPGRFLRREEHGA